MTSVVDPLAAVGILVGDGPGLAVVGDDRHLQHDAGTRRDRQERRVRLGPLLTQRWQHHRHDLFKVLQHIEKCGIETSRRVASRRRHEFVVEAELIEKRAQPRIVVRGKARIGPERIGHLGQRLAQMLRHHLLVGDVVGDLAQPVHVVGERDQPRLDLVIGENAKGVAHHRGARHFAERPDVRQAGRTIAGLEDHLVLRPLARAAPRSCAPLRTATRATARQVRAGLRTFHCGVDIIMRRFRTG